jgi:hypothetical protein
MKFLPKTVSPKILPYCVMFIFPVEFLADFLSELDNHYEFIKSDVNYKKLTDKISESERNDPMPESKRCMRIIYEYTAGEKVDGDEEGRVTVTAEHIYNDVIEIPDSLFSCKNIGYTKNYGFENIKIYGIKEKILGDKDKKEGVKNIYLYDNADPSNYKKGTITVINTEAKSESDEEINIEIKIEKYDWKGAKISSENKQDGIALAGTRAVGIANKFIENNAQGPEGLPPLENPYPELGGEGDMSEAFENIEREMEEMERQQREMEERARDIR